MLTREYKPNAITLDINLPDIEGWRVLERLKNDLAKRHIPVCVVSTDESRDRALSSGALAFVGKPLQSRDLLDSLLKTVTDFLGRKNRTIVVVEPDKERLALLTERLAEDSVVVLGEPNLEAATALVRDKQIDCLVVDADVSADHLDELLAMEDESNDGVCVRLPLIIHSFGNSDPDDSSCKRLAHSCVVHRSHSLDRLQDLVTLSLHRNVARLSESRQQMLEGLHHSDQSLDGKKVLIVDDDMRNIFALSTVLEEHNMVILSADNGRDAIKMLQADDSIDIVLMDIMMPEMDGMETMREIRKIDRLKNLPIVAVTAKAMKGDREKCIEAGAWDYLSKPVDPERMLAVLRAWLQR